MDESYSFPRQAARAGRRTVRPILVVALVAFLLGSALTFYLARGVDWLSSSDEVELADLTQDPSGADDAPAPVATMLSGQGARQVRQAAQQVEKMVEQQGGMDQRVAAMEQRLARLDLQAQATAGNTARAEGLLIAFAARRAIERGAPLGYLKDQLWLRFGDALPNAVAAVVAVGERPITLDRLLAGLDGLAPVLSQVPSDEGVLPRIGRELSQLFVIRSEDTPSPRPENRLERARLFLQSGRIEAAIAEIDNLPNAGEARAWIADAQRYARAEQALELLETTAILEPRQLRDGSGNTVEQPSPASQTTVAPAFRAEPRSRFK